MMTRQPDGTMAFRAMGTETGLYYPMNQNVRDQWMEMLRRTQRKNQGRLYLRRDVGISSRQVQYSPLGLLCEIAVSHKVDVPHQRYDDTTMKVWSYGARPQISRLPDEVVQWAGLASRGPTVSGIYLEFNVMDARYNVKSLGDSQFNWIKLATLLEQQL